MPIQKVLNSNLKHWTPFLLVLILYIYMYIYISVYHLYHCRIGEIPPIICAMEDEDHLTDNELDHMRPRPNLGNALAKEHSRILHRTEVELQPLKSRIN